MKQNNVLNILEDVSIVGGVTISLTMIQTILGIFILSVQAILILIKAFIKVYHALKTEKVDEAVDTLEETQDQLDDLKDKDGKH